MNANEIHNLTELSSLVENMGKTGATDFEAFDTTSGIEEDDLKFFSGSLLAPIFFMFIGLILIFYIISR